MYRLHIWHTDISTYGRIQAHLEITIQNHYTEPTQFHKKTQLFYKGEDEGPPLNLNASGEEEERMKTYKFNVQIHTPHYKQTNKQT